MRRPQPSHRPLNEPHAQACESRPPRLPRKPPAILLALFASLSLPAHAQPYDIAVAAAWGASGNPLDCRITDVKAKLQASGLFSSITELDVLTTTPSAAALGAFDAVLTWSFAPYHDPVAFGNALASYVDNGGAVVVAVFANTLSDPCCHLAGNWLAGHEVIPTAGNDIVSGQAFLGTLLIPSHPILQGVVTFDGGANSFRPKVQSVAPGATRIAEWSDGKTLLAVGANPARVDLGFYPPSNACDLSLWAETTDGAKLLSNALAFAASNASGGGDCYPDCDLDTILTIDDFICFQTYFALGLLFADCDLDTVLTIDDFICFQTFFAIGC